MLFRSLIFSLRKEYFMKEESDYFFRQLSMLGISAEELADMYRKFIKKQK